jgi:DNA polymerase III sliding clamp (beta) subunit (PCNA family)
MKFIVNSAYLLKQLSNINGVITTNPVVPILENFLFELDKGSLTVTASDLQTSMITELQVESKEKGSIAVPARILLDTLKNLPEHRSRSQLMSQLTVLRLFLTTVVTSFLVKTRLTSRKYLTFLMILRPSFHLKSFLVRSTIQSSQRAMMSFVRQ